MTTPTIDKELHKKVTDGRRQYFFVARFSVNGDLELPALSDSEHFLIQAIKDLGTGINVEFVKLSEL